MTDVTAVANHIGSLSADETISDGCARTIASWYQSSAHGDRGFLAFASSGTILPSFRGEITRVLKAIRSDDQSRDHIADRVALANLRQYLKGKGHRDAVAGWSNLWIR